MPPVSQLRRGCCDNGDSPLTQDSVEKLAEEIRSRALKNGASDAEASVRYVDSSRIEVSEGKVEGIRRSRETVAALRVLVDGRPGFFFSTDPDRDNVEGMVRDALDGARLVPSDENNRFSNAGSPAVVEGILDREGFDRPFEDKLDCARALESAALAADDKVKKTYKPSFGENFRVSAIASGDMVWSYEDTLFSVGVEAVAEDNGVSQTGYDYSVSKFFQDLDPKKVGETAGRMAAGLLGGAPPESGKYPAILPPVVVIKLIAPLLTSFSADEIQKGRSRLAGRSDEKVFSKLLTLTDDGLLQGGVGTVPFDDERVPPVPRKLVEKGHVKGFLHTLKTSAKESVEPTGNGFRGSLAQHPAAGTTNLILKPGKGPAGSSLPGGTAMRIETVLGAHTIDRVSGDFSLGAAGFVLENGEITVPFRNTTVSGNLFDLFSSLLAVGDDLTFYGSVGAPTVLVESIIISG